MKPVVRVDAGQRRRRYPKEAGRNIQLGSRNIRASSFCWVHAQIDSQCGSVCEDSFRFSSKYRPSSRAISTSLLRQARQPPKLLTTSLAATQAKKSSVATSAELAIQPLRKDAPTQATRLFMTSRLRASKGMKNAPTIA